MRSIPSLSRKAYCNNLMIMDSQPPVHEEFQKPNLGLVPQGYLANLTASPTLEDKIRSEKRREAEIKKTKENIEAGNVKYGCFSIDDKGTVFFEGRIAVPQVQSLKDVIPKEAHDTPLSIHPGSAKMYQDLKTMYWWSGMKREIAQYVSECDVCQRVKAVHQKSAGLFQPLKIPE